MVSLIAAPGGSASAISPGSGRSVEAVLALAGRMHLIADMSPLAAWKVTPEKIEQAARLLGQQPGVVRVILFGSQARGGAHVQSDADLLVICDSLPEHRKHAEMTKLRRLLSPLRLPVDVLLTDNARFDYWKDTPGNVYHEAMMDGRTLYERA